MDILKDSDLQDLYIIAIALRANRELHEATAVVRRICASHDYLMKPLIMIALEREGHKCPVE